MAKRTDEETCGFTYQGCSLRMKKGSLDYERGFFSDTERKTEDIHKNLIMTMVINDDYDSLIMLMIMVMMITSMKIND